MDNEKLIAVSLLVGDRTYRVRVTAKEEEQLRKTAKFLNDKVIEYKKTVAGKDMQDYIAMALLWYATQPPTEEIGQLIIQQGLEEQFEKMEQMIDKALTASTN
jgi:cell division protein ZapA (FtsZ GTPase activity inhibitor)